MVEIRSCSRNIHYLYEVQIGGLRLLCKSYKIKNYIYL